MLGLSPYDDNQAINNYKEQFGISNPCAGREGNAHAAIQTVIDGQTFFGYPTYCIVCPDKKLFFNVCFPPTPECFDTFILNCGVTTLDELEKQDEPIIEVYPNPASSFVTVTSNKGNLNRIEIYGAMGNKIIERDFNGYTNTFTISVSELPKGIYLLKIKSDQGIETKKIFIN